MRKSVFKTDSVRDQFRAYYNGILSRFPFEQRYIETAYGKTFILTAGQKANPPMILLHGSCSNSAFWFPEMMALSGNFLVYAVDIIGEAGNSEEFRPDLHTNDFALWMKGVLDALGLEKAIIIGNSLGGWMALQFATVYPERVSKLVLIASAGLAEIRPQFIDRVAKIRQSDETASVDSDIIGKDELPKEVLDFINLIIESYDPIDHLPVYEDNQLQRLTMPVLFIDGEFDAIIDTQQSVRRLTQFVPSAEIHLLHHCGHLITNSIEYIIPFLANDHIR